ncbi:MAG: DUF6431 domain-containing protein [Pseudonocardiaceae bacterium]
MVTVEANVDGVETRLAAGELVCPGCAGVLAGWGRARRRLVRGPDRPVWITPRRSRCTGCGVTHVLLPVVVPARRVDAAVVIGGALAAKAAGVGHRVIAAVLGRPVETVRGWLRRFGGRLEEVRAVFTWWCRALEVDPVLPGPAGSAWADAVAAVTAAAGAVAVRFGIGEVACWEAAAAVSAGRLLAPGWPPVKASG